MLLHRRGRPKPKASQGRPAVGARAPPRPERSGASRDSVRTKQTLPASRKNVAFGRPGGYCGVLNTRSHSEHGREMPQRQWYFVLRHGRVGRCQVCQMQQNIFSSKNGDCRYQAAVKGGFFVARYKTITRGKSSPVEPQEAKLPRTDKPEMPNRRPKAEDRQNKNAEPQAEWPRAGKTKYRERTRPPVSNLNPGRSKITRGGAAR